MDDVRDRRRATTGPRPSGCGWSPAPPRARAGAATLAAVRRAWSCRIREVPTARGGARPRRRPPRPSGRPAARGHPPDRGPPVALPARLPARQGPRARRPSAAPPAPPTCAQGAPPAGRRVLASAALVAGTTTIGDRSAPTRQTTPGTERTEPSSPSSPTKAIPSIAPVVTSPMATSSATASARSSPEPTLRIVGGARFTVVRVSGHGSPLDAIAARTRSRASRQAASGRPTMVTPGTPRPTCASTVTECPSTPSSVADGTVAITARSSGTREVGRSRRGAGCRSAAGTVGGGVRQEKGCPTRRGRDHAGVGLNPFRQHKRSTRGLRPGGGRAPRLPGAGPLGLPRLT